MMPSPELTNVLKIQQNAAAYTAGDRCLVAPSPDLSTRLKAELSALNDSATGVMKNLLKMQDRQAPGLNDGLIYPGQLYPLGAPLDRVRTAAADRAPLSGIVRVVVVLVEFSDKQMTETRQHFEELFFSTGVLPNGSVREYFSDVSNNIIQIRGEVVGPYTLPRTIVEYANGESGTGFSLPNARTMARDAAVAANPDVNFGPYDNDGDGFVDAFIVIHAGSGAEVTGNDDDIWSHKWVLSGGSYNADGTKIYAYLTVPEDARIGVCCHELGHLVFGWPDLYDTDYSSEGVGNWCLMGGGSWNGGGDVPAHPSAWCKADQGWVTVNNQTTNGNVNISDVKSSHSVYRLWKDGGSGNEYFLVENRQQSGYDQLLPGEGLLIWHIDESIATNSNENHPKVALKQADGNRNLENGDNRGDAGDPFPGSSNNNTFDGNSTPNSDSYAGSDTCVAVKNIGPSAPVMNVDLEVRCITKIKEVKEGKEFKEWKEFRKDFFKDFIKDRKEKEKEKEIPDGKELIDKRVEKPVTDKTTARDKFSDKLTDGGFDFFGQPGASSAAGSLEARVAALEAALSNMQPFIDSSLRPDLSQSALSDEEDVQRLGVQSQRGAAEAKRNYDTPTS